MGLLTGSVPLTVQRMIELRCIPSRRSTGSPAAGAATSQLKDAGAVAKGTDVENNCTHSWTKHEEEREGFRCA